MLQAAKNAERNEVERALIMTDWNMQRAARLLGLSEGTTRAIVARHPPVAMKYRRKGPGRGRPAGTKNKRTA